MIDKSDLLIEAEVVSSSDYIKNEKLSLNFKTKLFVYLYLLSALIFTIYFGGVHLIPRNLLFLISSVFCFFLTYSNFNLLASLFKKTFSSKIIYLSLFFIADIVLQKYIYNSIKVEHPVLGTSGKMYLNYGYFLHIFMPCFFLLTFIIFRILASDSYYRKKVMLFLSGTTFLVALISLSHWFYDNGKLFWFLEPNNIFISNRARWPFVNSNDAGIYFAAGLFIFMALFVKQKFGIKSSLRKRGREKSLNFSLDSKIFNKFLSISYILLMTFTIVLGLLATQSRGAWGGVMVCLFIYYINNLYKLKQKGKLNLNSLSLSKIIRNPFSKSILINIFFIFVIIFSVVIFLGSRGEELLNSRIEYAVTSSMDDIRWEFYEKSYSFFEENKFFGIGFRNWNEKFKTIKSDYLALMNPEYLHSDPYQLLIEIGIFGFIPFLFLFMFFIYKYFKNRIKLDSYLKNRSFLYLLALLCIVFSSFVEFPFRVPAIVLLFSCIMALFCEIMERDEF